MPGPSNLYGVANPVILPINGALGGPITCPAGVETTVFSTPALVAPSSGYFYPLLWFTAAINIGATLPASIAIAAKIGAGSDFDVYNSGAPALYANNWLVETVVLVGFPSNTAWAGSGSIVNITINPSGQPVNVANIKTVVALFRAPDQ